METDLFAAATAPHNSDRLMKLGRQKGAETPQPYRLTKSKPPAT